MNQQRSGLFRRILSFVFNIGADAEDSDYVRLIKRIYYFSAAVGCLSSLASALWYFLAKENILAWLFLFSFALFLGTTVNGFLFPRHFRWVAFIVLVYFVIGPVVVTFLLGGIWRTEGLIMIGLMGPLLGLVFFLKRRWAVALFLIYSGFVLGLSVLEPRLEDPAAELLAEIHEGYDLGRMVSRLNDFVFKSSDSRSFITFFFGELDRRTGEMRFINAGHNPPFVLRREGDSVALKSSGFALGMFPGATYESGTVRFGAGDLAAELCRKIIEDARGFRYETQPCDDITLVILKRADETSA